MIRIVEVNGKLIVLRVSNKLTNAQHADNWYANRIEIMRKRTEKAAKKKLRAFAREVNKNNRVANAQRRAAV